MPLIANTALIERRSSTSSNRQNPTRLPYSCHAQLGISGLGEPPAGGVSTVRGIGEALAQADKAVKGDIAGVTASLGVAFNSTYIALLISIFLMFLVHQLQLTQERFVYDTENYCDDKVIRHMKAD